MRIFQCNVIDGSHQGDLIGVAFALVFDDVSNNLAGIVQRYALISGMEILY